MNNLQLYMQKFPYSFSLNEHIHYSKDTSITMDLFNNKLNFYLEEIVELNEQFKNLEEECEHRHEQYIDASNQVEELEEELQKYFYNRMYLKDIKKTILQLANKLDTGDDND